MLRLESSKSGAKIIHLAGAAIDLLAAEREWASDNAKWVFPAARPDGDVDELSREWRRIRKATGIGDVRIHDLRHTFARAVASGGIGLPLIGWIRGHRQASTTQRYAHLADTPLRRAGDQIGRYIATKLTAPVSTDGRRVVRAIEEARPEPITWMRFPL
jgi:integrase